MGSIYKITNTLNGMIYIGATRNDPEKTRVSAHLNATSRGNRKIREAIAEYGQDAFTFEILCADVPPEHLDALEKAEIKKHNCVFPNGYNLTDENGSPCDETRKKMSEANTGRVFSDEHKRKLSKNNVSKRPEVRRKRSDSMKGENNPMYGKLHSEDTRRKMSENNGPKRPEVRRKMSEAKLGMSQEAFIILVRWLLRDGWSKSKIARELRKSRGTIAKYAKQGLQ